MDKYFDVLRTKLVSGIGPDLFNIETNNIEQYESAGFLEDLSNLPIISSMDNVLTENMKSAKSQKVYGIPMDLELWTVFYNYDFFGYSGINNIPKTWSEFLNCCEKLKKAGIEGIGGGFGDQGLFKKFTDCLQLNLLSSSEAMLQNYKLNIGQMKYSYEGCYKRAMFTKVAELSKKGYFYKDSFKQNQAGGIQDFATGKCAMLIMGSDATKEILHISKGINIGVFPLPGNDITAESPEMLPILANPWFINHKSSYEIRTAAKEFLNFIFTKTENKEFCEKNFVFSPLKDNNIMDETASSNPIEETFYKYLDEVDRHNYIINNRTPKYIKAEDIYNQKLYYIAQNPGYSVDAGLKECDAALESTVN